MRRSRVSRRVQGEDGRERWQARLAAISGPSRPFRLSAPFSPGGDQPQAIERLVGNCLTGARHQVLLGVTGSGKTFTIASVIERLQRPTLVLAPNKTLAAQLYAEFREFFPDNAVEYFVSYYDYYQPEAYVPTTDTYIEKDASINEQIEQLRLAATKALLERRDALIVATVSAIYGLGSPDEYYHMAIHLVRGERLDQREFLRRLSELQYVRGDFELRRGGFRVRGETVDLFPAEHEELAVRVELFDGEIDRLTLFDPLTGSVIDEVQKFTVYPRSHYVTTRRTMLAAVESIKEELRTRLAELEAQGRILEAERLRQRTQFDLEMLLEIGYCQGIENYSRHLTGRAPGEPPPTLFDYLPADALLVVDESHVTVPQLAGMYRGDRSRKQTLVDHGFRLPSALDNRPLRFEEWERRAPPTIFVSATPGPYELEKAGGEVVELVVRPTGLVDPELEVRPAARQVDDLLSEVRARVALGDRVLVTTLTKRMAEHLTEFLAEHGVRVRYLHADVETVERVEILRDLRLGVFDVLVGINLLREGLDLPEVSLVAILDADKEGFLRSTGSLIQTIGRCARNVRGKAILYADTLTDAMRAAIAETERRRRKQIEYNQRHGIVPRSVSKPVTDILDVGREQARGQTSAERPRTAAGETDDRSMPPERLAAWIAELEERMYRHARDLEFEEAARLRDRIRALRERALLG